MPKIKYQFLIGSGICYLYKKKIDRFFIFITELMLVRVIYITLKLLLYNKKMKSLDRQTYLTRSLSRLENNR